MLLIDFFRSVYRPRRLLGRSARTVELYEYSVRCYGESLGRDATLADLTDDAVARHLSRLIDAGYSPYSVKKERSQLVAMWNMAARKRLVPDFPDISPVPTPEIVPEAWTREELLLLRMSCQVEVKTYHGVKSRDWWLAIHLLLYATGERITAALLSKWSDLSGDVIVFPAENRKGSKRASVCRLPQYVLDSLEAIRNPPRELIFPFPFSAGYIYKLYHSILERADLATDHRSKFHRMRRTHATHLKIAGGDPTASLGHTNPATTARYIDPRQLPGDVAAMLPRFPEAI